MEQLALYIWEGKPSLIARALRRRGFKVRAGGRYIIFVAPAEPRDVDHALRWYMLNTGRTVSYQFVRL